MGMIVYVWVSTVEIPLIALILAKKVSSGANLLSSQAPNLSADTEVTTLKSMHPPQTTRWTPLTPSTFLTSANTASKAFCASCNDFLSLSGFHLHRHWTMQCWCELISFHTIKITKQWAYLPGNSVELDAFCDRYHGSVRNWRRRKSRDGECL